MEHFSTQALTISLAIVGFAAIAIVIVGGTFLALLPSNKKLVEQRRVQHEAGYNFAKTQIIYGGDIARMHLSVIVKNCTPRHVMPFIEGMREAIIEDDEEKDQTNG